MPVKKSGKYELNSEFEIKTCRNFAARWFILKCHKFEPTIYYREFLKFTK